MALVAVLRIKDWSEHFENNRTRELKSLTFVCIPNKLDGDGYTELIDHPNGISHYGAWVTIVHVASRCDPRGTLLRSGKKPHDSRSLGRITRVPCRVYEEAIPRLLGVGWLEFVNMDLETTYEEPQESAGIPQVDAGIPQHSALNGMEGKEGNRREGKERGPRAASVFVPPSLEEVFSYCKERSNSVDADAFVDFYTSKGWMVGKNKMKDWRASVRTWEKNGRKSKEKSIDDEIPDEWCLE